MHRRQYLALFGTGVAGSLAGCSSDILGADTPTASPTPLQETDPEVQIGDVAIGDTMSFVLREMARGEIHEPDEESSRIVYRKDRITIVSQLKNLGGEHLDMVVPDDDGTPNRMPNAWVPTLVNDNGYANDEGRVRGIPYGMNQDIFPGEVIYYKIEFEIPKHETISRLEFDLESYEYTQWTSLSVDLTTTTSPIGELSHTIGEEVHEVGESVKHTTMECTLNSVETATTIGEFDAGDAFPDEAAEYVIADVSVTNKFDVEAFRRFTKNIAVKDGLGRGYGYVNEEATFALEDGIFAKRAEAYTPLASGETRQGKIAYAVPKDRSDLYLTLTTPTSRDFDADWEKSFWHIR